MFSSRYSIALQQVLSTTRLGTCYSSLKGELLNRQNSFDLAKLAGADLLLFGSGWTEFKLRAESNNTSTSESSAFSLDLKGEAGGLLWKTAGGFSVEEATAKAKSDTDLTVKISY